MYFQISGLILDIIGVILLSFSGVFRLSGYFQYGPTKSNYSSLWMARIGLSLAIIGFLLQIYGVIQNS